MSFKVGPKVLIVNDPAQAQLLFYAKNAAGITRLVETDDDYNTATPFDQLATSPDTGPDSEGAGFLPATTADDETIGQAGLLRILGFGDFEGANISEVVGSKGITGAKQTSTITLSALTVVAGQELVVDFSFISSDFRGEFASNQSDYVKKRSFIIAIKAGDTLTTVAARLRDNINAIADSGWTAWITASAAVGVVTIVSTDPEVTFTATFSGTAVVAGSITAVHAVTVVGYEGRNTYEQLKGLRLETVNGPYNEEFKTKQPALKGAKYSCYTIRKTVSRPDLSGLGNGTLNGVPSGSFDFTIYINEATGAAYILALTKWLNANVARRLMYTATTAAAAVAAETPTLDVAVDASEPFSTSLV